MALIPATDAMFKSERNRALLTWSLVFAGLCAAAGYFYATRDAEPQSVPVAREAIPEPKPEVKLNIVVTECAEISSRVDWVGGTMVNLGENYRYMKGRLTNTGDITVKLVGVDTIWRNSDARVIQMGKVYVATGKPLAPGESIEFMDSTQNYIAVKCAARVADWWIVPETATSPDVAH